MSVTLAALVSRLSAAVPAHGGIPSATQYSQAVKDAVADYSRRRPLQRYTTVDIVAGTATYPLPDDFLLLIRLDTFDMHAGILNTAAGLIPLAGYTEEQKVIAGQTLTLIPTPAYTLTRSLWYGGAHLLDTGDAYPYLSEADASVVLLKAQAIALGYQARAAGIAREIVEWQIGDEKVKRANVVQSLRAEAEALEREYLEAVRPQPTGMPARYAFWEGTSL